MQFYRVDYYAPNSTDQATEWATTKGDAAQIALDNRCGDYDARITPVDIPTSKAGLLAFLNDNIWTHPGATWGGD